MALWCLDPYRPYIVGQRQMDLATRRVHEQQVPCGRCAACLANRKHDWTGRLVAEGTEAQSAMFLTLTYAEEPDHFRYSDVQTFLKGLRKNVARNWGAKVRFFCAGERGDENGRIHWHLMLFFDKRVWIPARRQGEKWSLWRHGWAGIEMLTGAQRIWEKSRYCVMYCLKAYGEGGDTPPARCSLGSRGDGPLGAAYFTRLAREIAGNGHMPDGKYRFPFIRYTRGPKEGQMRDFTLRGAARDWFIREWRAAWTAKFPERSHWCNEWLLRYDRNDADLSGLQGKRWIGVPTLVKPARRFAEAAHRPPPVTGWEARYIVGKGWGGVVSATPHHPFGRVTFDDDRDLIFWDSVGEVLDLDAGSLAHLDRWVHKVRGPQWKGRAAFDEQQEEEKARVAERRQRIREHCAEEVERLRKKHGVHASAHGIYRSGTSAARSAAGAAASRDARERGGEAATLEADLRAEGCYVSDD